MNSALNKPYTNPNYIGYFDKIDKKIALYTAKKKIRYPNMPQALHYPTSLPLYDQLFPYIFVNIII